MPSYLNPLFFGLQMWYLLSWPRFTPQFLQIWDVFARSKFEQIHFLVQCIRFCLQNQKLEPAYETPSLKQTGYHKEPKSVFYDGLGPRHLQ